MTSLNALIKNVCVTQQHLFAEQSDVPIFSINQVIQLITVKALLCFCICCGIKYLKMQNKLKKLLAGKSPIKICNPMVIVIAIGEYDNHPGNNADPEFADGYLNDLEVGLDINSVKAFCDKYGYDLYPTKYREKNLSDPKLYWTAKEILNALKNYAKIATDREYDGIVCVISAHGTDDKIITSDYQGFQKIAMHRVFSVNYPQLRKIPRIFIFDSCEGDQEQERYRSRSRSELEEESNDTGKGITVEDVISRKRYFNTQWTSSEFNPDYMLCLIHAANSGFKAKMNTTNGSYLIHGFVEEAIENIDKRKNEFLGDMMDRVEMQLHDAGKQQIVVTYLSNTRNVKFRDNPDEFTKLKDNLKNELM
eukprot:515549_1